MGVGFGKAGRGTPQLPNPKLHKALQRGGYRGRDSGQKGNDTRGDSNLVKALVGVTPKTPLREKLKSPKQTRESVSQKCLSKKSRDKEPGWVCAPIRLLERGHAGGGSTGQKKRGLGKRNRKAAMGRKRKKNWKQPGKQNRPRGGNVQTTCSRGKRPRFGRFPNLSFLLSAA